MTTTKTTPAQELVIRTAGFEGSAAKFIASYQGNLSKVMPRHIDPEAFIALAAAYVANDPKLHAATVANAQSLVLALRRCAALGHLPEPDTFALVPFRRTALARKEGGPEWQITGIETYRGVIERMFRAGGVQAVTADVVRVNDFYQRGLTLTTPPVHEYDDFASIEDRGVLRGVYAYAVLFNGATSHVVRMGAAEVAKHRAVSKSGDAFWGPAYPAEGPWTPSMWLKTGLHALERWVPTSAAYRWEVAASQAKVAMDPVRPPAPDRAAEPIDAEVLEDDTGWPDVAQPPADPKVIT